MQNNIYKMGPTLHNVELESFEDKDNCNKFECNKIECDKIECNKLECKDNIDNCYKCCLNPSPGLLAGILAIIYAFLFIIIPLFYSWRKNSNKDNDIEQDIYNKIN